MRRAPDRTWRAAGAAVLVALAARAAGAQQDSVRINVVRATTPFEVQVERISRQLVEQQRRVATLSGTRQQLLVSLRTPSIAEETRHVIVTRLRAVEGQLSSIAESARALRAQLEQLCASTRAATGWLGVAFNSNFSMDASPDGPRLAMRRYPEIESVEPGSPAEKSGIRRGDVLLTLGGRDLSDAELSLTELLKPGTRLAVRLKRGVETRNLNVLIEPRPADFQPTCAWEDDVIARALSPAQGYTFVISGASPGSGDSAAARTVRPQVWVTAPEPPGQSPVNGYAYTIPGSAQVALGAQLVPLNEGLASLSGVERGLFVVDVVRRSPAAQSGLMAGDVIVSADGRVLRSPAALLQLMGESETRELPLQLVRRRKPETIVLKW